MNNWRGRQVLVTGGAGFIGSHVVDRLVELEARVTVADDLRSSQIENLESSFDRIKLHQYDIRSTEFFELLKQNSFEYLFHFASNAKVGYSVENPFDDFRSTLSPTIELLELIRKYSPETRFIFPSSAAVYGNPLHLPMTEDDPTFPISPYGVAKLSSERYAAVYSRLYGLKTCSLRSFSVYGPRQKKLVVYDLITRLMRNKSEIHIYGNGEQCRDFIYISDVVNAFLLAADSSDMTGDVFNVASGVSTSVNSLVEIIAAEFGFSPVIVHDPGKEGDPDIWVSSIEKIRKELGFSPEVSIKDGIKEVISHLTS